MNEPRLLRIPERMRTVDDVLGCTKQLNLANVLVLSELESGELVMLHATDLTVSQVNWLLDRCKACLMGPHDFKDK